MQNPPSFMYKYLNGNKIHKSESSYKPSKINASKGIGVRARKSRVEKLLRFWCQKVLGLKVMSGTEK